jgi:hypothetical protein
MTKSKTEEVKPSTEYSSKMTDLEINYVYTRGDNWYITPSYRVAQWRGETYYAIETYVKEETGNTRN